MKNIKLLSILCMAAMVAVSCKKLEVKDVDFNVSTAKQQYHVGDTVTFNFSGNPDNITFYSGEAGHRYENRDRVVANGAPQLTFSTYRRNLNTGTQEHTLFLYASTDFTGQVDVESIEAATWTDITGRATFSTGDDFTPSGIVDISDFVSNDKPVYFAFKYMGYAGSPQRIWNVKSFDIVNILPDEPVSTICNLDDAGWLSLSLSGDQQWTISPGNVYFYGPASAAATVVPNEDWLISKPLFLNKVYPDKGVPLKNMSVRLNQHTYTFNTPGTYTVAFVASNLTIDNEKSVVKTLTIKVEP